MRITGLASGMDIDTMVSQLMKAERMPVDRLFQKKQLLQWKQDSYREMNKLLLELKDTVFNLKLQSTYQAKKSSVSDTSIVSATATAATNEGIYNIKVTQLAKSASLTSNALGANGDSTKTLADLYSGSSSLPATISLAVTGAKGTEFITLNSTDSVSTLVNTINGKSSTTGVQVSYDANLDRLFFVSSTTGESANIELSAGADDAAFLQDTLKLKTAQLSTGTVMLSGGLTQTLVPSGTSETLTVNYNGAAIDFTITDKTTTADLLDQINNNADLKQAGIAAYLDSNNLLAFYNPNSASPVTFSGTAAPTLGLDAPSANTSYLAVGQDARVNFNGITGEYASNTFSINNINFTAKKADLNTTVSVSVTKDVDTVYGSIKSFVDKYNEIIDQINKKIAEPRYRDFLPLTDSQKKEMSDKDIENWEAKAKSGVLYRDSILSGAVNGIRGSLYEDVTGLPAGEIKNMTEIGITTGNYTNKGKLFINETKLKEAISNSPDQVMRLFNANDGVASTHEGDGLAVRISEQITFVMKQLTDKAFASSSIIGKDLDSVSKKITRMEALLTDKENRYYKQFTAMEKAINQMNSQSAWLSSQMGGQ